MGRSPRVEYPGAVYHIMSRGNRKEPVFKADGDYRSFLDTLGEACERTGWLIHAYVLMGNHYHLLLETPEANLVDGMRWLQGTYTKRFNAWHQQVGHLFQGRYKALLVDSEESYFKTVSSYIHLNPARAKCFNMEKEKLSDYRWSSYPLFLRPSYRPEWLEVERTLGSLGLRDNRSGRMQYRKYMEGRVLEIASSNKPHEVDDQWAKIRRGWVYGGDEFRNHMQEALGNVMKGKRRDSFGGESPRKHDELEAEAILIKGLELMKVSSSDLDSMRKGDDRKKVIAWAIRKRTSVRNEWIAAHLKMGRASNLSYYVREVDQCKSPNLKKLRKIMR